MERKENAGEQYAMIVNNNPNGKSQFLTIRDSRTLNNMSITPVAAVISLTSIFAAVGLAAGPTPSPVPSAASQPAPIIAQSTYIKGFEWIGKRQDPPNPNGDTYPMTWADDDVIYTSAGDPVPKSGLDIDKITGDPSNHKVISINPMKDYKGWGGGGPKPTGMICVKGVLYLAFQNLLGNKPPLYGKCQHGDDAQIVSSADKGVSWARAIGPNQTPMFPGHKFGGPAFINFGQNNANARDHYVYAVSSDQWDCGKDLRLGRVPDDRIVDPKAWEWVCGFTTSREPVWNHDLEASIPVLSLKGWLGAPDMVYLSGIKRYLLVVWHLRNDFNPKTGTDLLILESPEPWGPFSQVYREELWEFEAFTPYCPRIPLKWMQPDGVTGWMQFSGAWNSSYYHSHARQFRLLMADTYGAESVVKPNTQPADTKPK